MSARRAAKVPSAADGRGAGRAEAVAVVLGAVVAASALNALRTAEPTVVAASVASSLVVPGAAAWSVLRRRPQRVTSADRVTLVRVTLTGVLTAALVLAIADQLPARTWTVLIIAAVATVLDAVDGWVARHTDDATAPGARFDPEADAAALLVLSGLLALTVGWWVLLIGLMRYLFAAAAIIRPAWRGNLAISGFRKAVAAGQATALVVGLAPIVPVPLAAAAAASALGALCVSFGRDVLQLERAGRADGSVSEKQT